MCIKNQTVETEQKEGVKTGECLLGRPYLHLLTVYSLSLLLSTHFAPQIEITDKMETKDAVSSLTRPCRHTPDG